MYPFQGNDRIYASDRSNGLFILTFNGARKGTITGLVRNAVTLAPIPGAAIITPHRQSLDADRRQRRLYAEDGSRDPHAARERGRVPSAERPGCARKPGKRRRRLPARADVGGGRGAGGRCTGRDDAHARALAEPDVESPSAIRTFVPGTLGGKPLTLAIYGVNGTLVRSFERGAAIPGVQAEPWDGRDAMGQPVGPGVYFVRLAVGDEVRSAKLVVAR